MSESEEYLFEEYHTVSNPLAWAILIGLSLLLVTTGIFVHRMVPDPPREWDYGAMETIPGESVYASLTPDPGQVSPAETDKIPKQIAPLPGAQPLEKLKPQGYEQVER